MHEAALSDSEIEFIAGQLEHWTGLHFGPERRSDLTRGVARLQEELRLESPEGVSSWLRHCSGSFQEQALLARTFTVGETHFYRDRPLFDRLARWLGERNFEPAASEPLRIWSAGCSSGEEVYTLAALLTKHLGRQALANLDLLGTDLNEDSLRRARRAVYGKWSFRDVPGGFQSQFFQPHGEGLWKVHPDVARLARFQSANLTRGMLPAGPFDLILCRNVVMYFRTELARTVLQRLVRRLKPDGLLVVTAAEAGLLEAPTAEDWGPGVFRLPTAVPPEPSLQAPAAAPIPEDLSLQAQACWQLASDKADRGELEDALQHCREVLRERPTMAEAYRLQARILDGLNRLGEAASSLRQALILEPDRFADHFLLGALLERAGDRARALEAFRAALALRSGEDWTRAAAAQAVERLEPHG